MNIVIKFAFPIIERDISVEHRKFFISKWEAHGTCSVEGLQPVKFDLVLPINKLEITEEELIDNIKKRLRNEN